MLRNAHGLLRAAVVLAAILPLVPAQAQPVRRGNGPLFAGSSVAPASVAPEEGVRDGITFYLTVLHNNDGESQLLGLENADFGNVARFKTLVDQLKNTALTDPGNGIPRGVLMLSSGDNFLAGPEFNASLNNGVPYYDGLALNLVGYDAMAIGNHEFDFGPDVFADFINSFASPPAFVSANLDVSGEPNLQVLADANVIVRSVVITENGQQIGVVGATTPALPFISSPRNVEVDPNVAAAIQSQIDAFPPTVNKVVLISHLQSIQEDLALIPTLTGVDIAVAGGGDELLANPDDLLVPGDEGHVYGPYPLLAGGVPVITTSGSYAYVGRLIVGFDAAGEVVEISDESGPVRVASTNYPDGVLPDPTVQALVIDPVAAYVDGLANNVIAQSEVALDGSRPNIRIVETNEGNLCADALFWQATVLADAFGVGRPHVALQNGGGIRNNSVIPAGEITELDTWDIFPFSNFVSIVENIPAAQFKEIMENAVSRVAFVDGRFAQIAGFRLTWSPAGTAQVLDANGNVAIPGTRVREIVLNDGTYVVRDGVVVADAPAINVATINFLATGGDQYPFRGAPFTTLGVTYQQALRNYIVDYLNGLISALDYREGGEGRIIELPAFYLTILHHNDGESQLINAGLGLEDFGGVARFKTLADQLKAEALADPGDGIPRGVVMLTSGDNYLAGAEFNASLEHGVPYYDSIALDLIGYDACTLGNHDFDFGPDVLEDFIVGFALTDPTFLGANLDFSQEPGLQALVDQGRIAGSKLITIGDQKIGVVGAITPRLAYISSPRDVVVSEDLVGAIGAEIAALKAAGANKLILSSHLQNINEELMLAQDLQDLDVIIAGGGGELLANPGDLLVPGDSVYGPYPLFAADATGKDIPVVTTEGDYKYIGRLVLAFDRFGNIVEISDTSGPVRVSGSGADAVTPDPDVQTQVVDPVAAYVANLASDQIGVSEVALDGRRPNIRIVETNEGNLCADSLLWSATQRAPLYGAPLPHVAVQNGGGIRNNSLIPAGPITALTTFNILPFANFVSIVQDVSPAHFKEILENAVSRVEFVDGRFAQIAGCIFAWNPAGQAQTLDADGNVVTPGTRVVYVELSDGRVIVSDGIVDNSAGPIHVATIDFLARGGDQYPFRGAPFTTLGLTYQQALAEYIEVGLAGLVSAADYPEGGEGRIVRIGQGLPSGVAAGDVTQSSALLWARALQTGPLTFEWGTDPTFANLAGTQVVAVGNPAVPAKALVTGLLPDTQYYYRVVYNTDGNFVAGQFRTAAEAGNSTGLRFGVTGDWQQAPPYPSLQNVPGRDLEFFLKLGDTIYADTETPALPGIVQARNLFQFRTKHAETALPRPQTPLFNALADLMASTSLLVTIDDHELVDNFAGGAAPGDSPDAPDVHPDEPPMFTDPVTYVNQTVAYQEALQAVFEYHPIENLTWSVGDPRMNGRPKLYRNMRYGDDAAVFVLDSRSFRDAQLPPVSNILDPVAVAQFIAATFTPGRTLLGTSQLDAVKGDLLAAETAGVTWKFVVIPEPIQNFGPLNAEDRFEGYSAERTELLAWIHANDIDNVVFLSADFHGTLVNNLTFGPPGSLVSTSAIEIVTGPAAFYSGLFGPAVVNIAYNAGLIGDAELAFYQSLPVAPDGDSLPNDKDDFLKTLLNQQITAFGYDAMGLNDNLPGAAGLFDATLLAGDYVAAHVYSWAEFEVDQSTQDLTVTLWGIPAYSEAEFLADPAAITALQPQVTCQFRLVPQGDGPAPVQPARRTTAAQ